MNLSDFTNKATPADTDLFLVVDGSTGLFENIQASQLKTYLGASGSGGGVSPITDAIKASYLFDDNTGTTLTDHSGNGYNGTLVNSTAWCDVTGVGIDFSGGGYINLPSLPWNAGNFTVEVVSCLRSVQQWARFFDIFVSAGNANIFVGASNGMTGKAVFSVANNSSDHLDLTVNLAQSLGIWTHHFFNLSNGVASVYQNALLILRANSTIPFAGNRTTGYIGRSAYSGDGYLDGIIANLQVWQKSLSNSEMGQQYKSTKQRLAGYGIYF